MAITKQGLGVAGAPSHSPENSRPTENATPDKDREAFIDQCYQQAFDHPNMASFLRRVGAPTYVVRENFRTWIENIAVFNPDTAVFAKRIMLNVQRKMDEWVNRLRAGVMTSALAVVTPVGRRPSIPIRYFDENSCSPEIVIPPLRSVKKAALAEAAEEFGCFIAFALPKEKRRAVPITFAEILSISNCLFDDGGAPWFDETSKAGRASEKLRPAMLGKLGLRGLFESGNDGEKAFEDFMVQIYFWRRHLKSNGFDTLEARGMFSRILNELK